MAVYFLLLLLNGKILTIYMLITAFLKPEVLTLIDLENLTNIGSFIYLLLSTCYEPNNNFFLSMIPSLKFFPTNFHPTFLAGQDLP